LFTLIALVAIPACMSGYAAQIAMKDNPDVSMAMIQTHQGAALLAFISMEITGIVSLLGLWRFSRTVKNPWMTRPARANLVAVLFLAAVTVGLMAVTGTTGGDIRHPEIVSGPEPTAAIGDWGAKIPLAFRFVVVDYSMWIWPVFEDLHFLGLILLLGSTGVLNLRILGFLIQLPVAPFHCV